MTARQINIIRGSIFFIITLIFLGAIHAEITSYRNQTSTKLVSPVIAQAPQETKQVLAAASSKTTLKDAIQTVVVNNNSFGIYVKDLKNGESYAENEHQTFETASLYKLWIMAETYHQIADGKLKEDQLLSEDVPKLNSMFQIASESAEKKEGTVSETVSDALERMITVSDNYSALLLSERIGLSNVQQFLQTHGLNESYVGVTGGTPKTTASDIGLFLQKLYDGSLNTQENTEKMIGLLKRQQLNGKLPKYLPKETDIAHKTGELGGLSHDAGIVFTPSGNYIIVVLTNTKYPPVAVEQIAQVSSVTYTYFTQNINAL
jgi:beta-lactamase class A